MGGLVDCPVSPRLSASLLIHEPGIFRLRGIVRPGQRQPFVHPYRLNEFASASAGRVKL
jgi:hypothetical protein